jgi:type II secretory ATPase GspE/PulE/Tfp pilus assembly ATPase PilB-like protein
LFERHGIGNDVYNIALASNEEDVLDVLVSACDFSEEELGELCAEYYGLKYTDLKCFSKIPEMDYVGLESILVLPFDVSSEHVSVAILKPNDLETDDKLKRYLSLCNTTKNLSPIYCITSKNAMLNIFNEINKSDANSIDRLISDAMRTLASDIHITPFQKTFKIMLRIDGILTDYRTLFIGEFQQLSIALKVMAKLDISETRRPQSGHFQKGNIDFRISTHPTTYGENIVIRILNKDKELISIENIGFTEDRIAYLKHISTYQNGMIIFCGPTGSGKTTSIYSLLEVMDKKSRNIMTLEDPVEYKIANVRQTEITRGVIEFAEGVRSILRQDPDVILIGEIRDEETAKMAVRASMTGHLVLTTIHSNDSFGVISRLREFNIPNSLIADNIIAIISQRLVRKNARIGRTIVSEILKISRSINEMICFGENIQKLRDVASSGDEFRTIEEDMLDKIKKGEVFQLDFVLQ